jgi:hypothetical protein
VLVVAGDAIAEGIIEPETTSTTNVEEEVTASTSTSRQQVRFAV